MSDRKYKGKTIVDWGRTAAERRRVSAQYRWGVNFLYQSARGQVCVMDFFPTLWHAKRAIDLTPNEAL